MKLLFEVNTTFSQPIFISVNDNITLWDFHNILSQQINSFLEESETDIIDVFVENDKTVESIPNTDVLLIDYLNNNPIFFHKENGSIEKNFHKIFIMDSQHLKTINNQQGLNTKIFKNVFNNIKKFMPTLYF